MLCWPSLSVWRMGQNVTVRNKRLIRLVICHFMLQAEQCAEKCISIKTIAAPGIWTFVLDHIAILMIFVFFCVCSCTCKSSILLFSCPLSLLFLHQQLAGRWSHGTSVVYLRAVQLNSTMCWNIPRSLSTITLSLSTATSAPWSLRMESPCSHRCVCTERTHISKPQSPWHT